MFLKKLKNEIKFSRKIRISNLSKTFIVAEISANHSGSLRLLKKTMLKAKLSGADAVKIQSYQANTMTLDSRNKNFLINDKSIWKGKYLYSLYQKAETPFKWHKEIFKFAKKNKILCFSAPFDPSAVELLEKCGCPIYKLASPEIEDLRLIRKIAKTKKPIIISTGIANEDDIKKLLPNKVFTFVGENPNGKYPGYTGWYKRKIGGKEHLKIMLGKPIGAEVIVP